MDFILNVIANILATLIASVIITVFGYVIRVFLFPRRRRRRRSLQTDAPSQPEENNDREMSAPELLIAGCVSVVIGAVLLYASYLIGLELRNGAIEGVILGLLLGAILATIFAVGIFRLWSYVSFGLIILAVVIGVFLLISFIGYIFIVEVMDVPTSFLSCFLITVFLICTPIAIFVLEKFTK